MYNRHLVAPLALLFVGSIFISVPLSQRASGPPTKTPLAKVLPGDLDRVAIGGKLNWSQAFSPNFVGDFSPPTITHPERLHTPTQVIVDIEAFAAEGDEQHALARRYKTEISALFESMTRVGAEPGRFVYDTSEIPLLFAWKGDSLAVVVTGVALSTIYNTIQLDPNKRAATALRSTILPSLSAFSAFRNAPDIKYFGVSVVYGSRDFLGDSYADAESLTFIASADQCRKFAASELTEDEFVAAADIYLSDRDMLGIKKIKLTLQ